MATVTIPSGANYAAMDTIIENNTDRVFVVEVDSGRIVCDYDMTREGFDDLEPGESFTIHAVCDTWAEATAFEYRMREAHA